MLDGGLPPPRGEGQVGRSHGSAAAAGAGGARGVPFLGCERECNLLLRACMNSTPQTPRGDRRRERRAGLLARFMNGFFTLVRWIDGRLGGAWADLGAYLVLGLLAVLAPVGGFLLLGHLVAGESLQRADVAILRGMRRLESPVLDLLALVGTALGSSAAAYLVLGVAGILFWRSGRQISALLLLVTLVGTRALIEGLKGLYDRPRPGLLGERIHALGMTFEFPQSASFPSGHAITAVAAFGTLAYLAARVERSRRRRRAILLGAAGLVLVIGFSRLYFAVHYPTDVVAGMLAGAAWATVCALALEVAMYASRRRGERLPREIGLDDGLRPVRDTLRGDPDELEMEPRQLGDGTS